MHKISEFLENCKSPVDHLNILRVLACMMVFILHGLILVKDVLPSEFWTRFLYTPAWAGVWIFFILSGYLSGKSFKNKRYTISAKGILYYYKTRFLRIAPSYYFFILLITLFTGATFFIEHPKIYLHLFTFTYDDTKGLPGFGATWYLSTIFQLYLMAPFLVAILSHLKYPERWLVALALLGLCYRLTAHFVGIDWQTRVYVFSFANLDLFAGGILLNYINKPLLHINVKKVYTTFALFIICHTILYSFETSWIYTFYQCVMPFFYIVFTSLIILYSRDGERGREYAFMPIINIISALSLYIYLWHSSIFIAIKPIFTHIQTPLTFPQTVLYYIITFCISVIIAYFFHVCFDKKRTFGSDSATST